MVLVYVSAPDQRIALWFRVVRIETLSVAEMWQVHHERLGIEREPYEAYFDGSATATGLHVGDVHPLAPEVSLAEIRSVVPDFVPPQGLIRMRDSTGRYEGLLPRLSAPQPAEVFPQQPLFASVVAAGWRT